jgi:hypothetical protein
MSRPVRWPGKLGPDLVCGEQQLADACEHGPERLPGEFLDAVTDLRQRHGDRSSAQYPGVPGSVFPGARLRPPAGFTVQACRVVLPGRVGSGL